MYLYLGYPLCNSIRDVIEKTKEQCDVPILRRRRYYVLQEKMHEAHGHHIDAQQARQMMRYLDDIINLMQIQIKARQDGG